MAVAEEAIQDGVYNRLTHKILGITVEAGKYCANSIATATEPDRGGVRRWMGDVSIGSPAAMIEWAKNGPVEGPIVLIVVGETYEVETDRAQAVLCTYSIGLFIITSNLRSRREGGSGALDGAARAKGVWDVKADILDRLCNFPLVSTTIDSVVYWEDAAYPTGGRLLAVQDGLFLYELDMRIKVSQIHSLTAWSDLADLEGIDTTLQVEPDAGSGEEFQVKIKNDVP